MLIANQDEVTSISNKHFNTSHVNVNQSCWVSIGPLNFISIHLMLMLIQLYIQSFEPIPDFNTSHVNVNPFKALKKECTISFQYISC